MSVTRVEMTDRVEAIEAAIVTLADLVNAHVRDVTTVSRHAYAAERSGETRAAEIDSAIGQERLFGFVASRLRDEIGPTLVERPSMPLSRVGPEWVDTFARAIATRVAE